MKAVLIVGNTGRGKSTAARELLEIAKLENRKIFVYDPNNEYQKYYNGKFTNIKEFLELVNNEKNAFILFEEATIFFSNKGYSDMLVNMLVRKRHQNNEIVLLFHSLRSIPTYILELCNFLVLYKTNDRESYTNKTFEGYDEILDGFNKLKNTPDNNRFNFHKNFIIELNKPVSYF
jgi:ABC-type oligopeptide transport system ATPase subunit